MLHRIDGRLTGKQYINILEDALLPSAWARFGTDELIPFVQDLSSIHTSDIVMNWFEDEGVSFQLLPWPPKGADMNPIENVWAEMVRDLDCQRGTANDLWDSVLDIWNHLSLRPNYWRTLINSMPQRLRMVIEAEGD
jgi:transposase